MNNLIEDVKHEHDKMLVLLACREMQLEEKIKMTDDESTRKIQLIKSHDPEAGAYYFKFSNKQIAKTTEEVGDMVNIDWDENDNVVGLELLQQKPQKRTVTREEVSGLIFNLKGEDRVDWCWALDAWLKERGIWVIE